MEPTYLFAALIAFAAVVAIKKLWYLVVEKISDWAVSRFPIW